MGERVRFRFNEEQSDNFLEALRDILNSLPEEAFEDFGEFDLDTLIVHRDELGIAMIGGRADEEPTFENVEIPKTKDLFEDALDELFDDGHGDPRMN